MAGRRKPLTFSELDNFEPRGKGAILRSAEEVAAEQVELKVEELQLPESKKSRNQEIKKSRKLEIKPATEPDDIYLPDAPSVDPAERASYKKSTYRIRPEALEALEDTKRLMRRTYGIKVNLEVIVEEAILAACRDLLENGDGSQLVHKFSGILEDKKS